ncbi:MAG: DUF4864 domain-containing protein [Chthoniobacteraceae bacterium]|nr:DUF4864 domain-containing protein [Chthoniobacteraceae bacterium]
MSPRGKITLVLCCLGVCAAAAWVHVAGARRSAALKPVELFDVVRQQYDACRGNDYPNAYRQASASIQQRFPLERFAGMARNDYARVVKSGRVEFGAWQRQGRQATVEVFYISRDGTVLPCLYTLVREGEAWKIDGMRWGRAWQNGQPMRGLRS